ncbi:MAG: MFS transporter [Pseudomonadales bacterium]|nr:MFS transporter [Pseudomonadales bacterium]
MTQPSQTAQASNSLNWHLSTVSAWFIPFGIQAVLYPWLVAFYLNEPAERVGFAQMCLLIPNLFLILFGGLIADRHDERTIMIRLHVVIALPSLVLAAIVYSGGLSYPVLIGYALTVGTISAFMNPARDSMLNRVAGENLQQAVIKASGVQFGVQVVGFLIAGSADRIGVVSILLIQAAFLLTGVYTAYKLPKGGVVAVSGQRQKGLHAILDGLKMALGDRRLMPAIVINISIGLFYMSTFMVYVPILIRDHYGAQSSTMALASIVFMSGTILATVILLRIKGIQRPGRALMLAMLLGGVAIFSLSFQPPLPLLLLALLIWGMGAAVSMSMGRSIIQEYSPPTHRARILSLFQLGFMGGAPLGAVAMGQLIPALGLKTTAMLPPAAMLIVLLSLYLFTDFSKLESGSEL